MTPRPAKRRRVRCASTRRAARDSRTRGARRLRGHRRAAGAVRRRHAHVRRELSDRLARAVRRIRRAPDRRRDRGRLRPHRHAVRVRAGAIAPDFLCLSKGLTGGTLPLSAVLTTHEVYDAFYAEYSAGKAFLHSHSYTGNPLACRAALATLVGVARRTRARTQSRARRASRETHRAACRASECRRRAPDRHDRGDRAGARQGDARAVSRRPNAADCAFIGTASNAASCCGRSATSSISCRRIASRRRRSTSWSMLRSKASAARRLSVTPSTGERLPP